MDIPRALVDGDGWTWIVEALEGAHDRGLARWAYRCAGYYDDDEGERLRAQAEAYLDGLQ